MRYPKVGDKVKINDRCVCYLAHLKGKTGTIYSIYGLDIQLQNICLILDDKNDDRPYCGFTMAMLDII